MSNGKLREARTSAERLAAVLVMVVNRNEANNVAALSAGRKEHHILSAGDFLQVVQKSLHELTTRETTALFQIAELIRKLELLPMESEP